MPFGYRELRAWPLLPAPLLSLSLECVSTHVRLKEFYLPDARVLVCARACARVCVYKLVELKYSQARWWWWGVLFIARIGESLSLQLARATRQINSEHQI